MTAFGHSELRIIPLDYSGHQFELYNSISRNYSYSIFFESLTGPEELAETSIMGFDPAIVVKGYAGRVVLRDKNGNTKTITTSDTLSEIKKLLTTVTDQKYRYLGGAVGIINYDEIDRKSTRLNSSHIQKSRMPSSA